MATKPKKFALGGVMPAGGGIARGPGVQGAMALPKAARESQNPYREFLKTGQAAERQRQISMGVNPGDVDLRKYKDYARGVVKPMAKDWSNTSQSTRVAQPFVQPDAFATSPKMVYQNFRDSGATLNEITRAGDFTYLKPIKSYGDAPRIMKKGGTVKSSAAKKEVRGDGIAQRGKTKGRMV